MGKYIGSVKALLCLFFSLALLSGVTGCGKEKGITGSTGGDAVEMADVVSFDFSYQNGSEEYSGPSYRAEATGDGRTMLTIRPAGVSDEFALRTESDVAFLKQLDTIISENKVSQWNGFNRVNHDAESGEQFKLTLTMENNHSVTASGTVAFPAYYSAVKSRVEEAFLSVYNGERPSRRGKLQSFLDSQILSQYETVPSQPISYHYLSAGGANFDYASYQGAEGVIGYRFLNMSEEGYGSAAYADPGNLIVLYASSKPAANRDYKIWQLRFEAYGLDEHDEVKQLGGDVLDYNLFYNDGLYAYIFLHEDSGKVQLGYFEQKSNLASKDQKTYWISLYELSGGEVRKVAEEGQKGSHDSRAWSYEELENFVDLGAKFNMHYSLEHWKGKPFDPIVDNKDITRLVTITTRSSYGKGFRKAISETAAGEPLPGFEVTGSFETEIG